MNRLKILLFICTLVSMAVYPQSNLLEIFNRYELKFEHTIEDIFTDKLNNDGLADLLVLTNSPESKILNIYFQKEKGFSNSPDQRLHFDEKAIIFCCGEVTDRYQGKEIVYLTRKGIYYYFLKGNLYNTESEHLMDKSSIYLSKSEESPVRSNFILKIPKENNTIIFIPEAQKLTLCRKGENKDFQEYQKINLAPVFTISSWLKPHKDDLDVEMFSNKVIVRVPRIYHKDFNGDKKNDLISVYKDKLEVFLQGEKGVFSLEPNFKIGLAVLTEEEKEKILRPNFTVKVVELNNDGLMDVVVTKTTIKSSSSLTKIYVYQNKGGKIKVTPDQIMVLDNCLGAPNFCDLNNDGKKDLIVYFLNQFLKGH